MRSIYSIRIGWALAIYILLFGAHLTWLVETAN